ncbi:hypothetical protein [Rhodopseudomonas palustris]|uniref:Uncharacterized protein n=1 Tax=Rhodopseudomonas palustris (strain BisB18) TaxID=316056 RepID=Q215W1_RHOPB
MPITFEEQFKYRDERNLNAAWFRICCDSKNHCGAALCADRPGLVYLRRCDIDNHRGDHAGSPRTAPGQPSGAAAEDHIGVWGESWFKRRAAIRGGTKTRASANTSESNFTAAVTRR